MGISRQKILIVDDSSENIELLFLMLQDEYDVIFSTSGSKALQLAEKAEPDLILLDIIMPEMDGYDVISQLKQNSKTQDIPVIFLTAKTAKSDLLKGFKLGSVDYIVKPFFEEEIKVRIHTHLQNRLLVKQLELANQKLELLSLSDALTGIGNRRYFDQFLEQMFSISQREYKKLSLLMIDVDYFKKYNDCFGHIKGDQCLQKIAKSLDDFANRGGDLAARYGGEEFALILSDTNAENAEKCAHNYLMAVQNLQIPHSDSHISDFVTVSIGITTISGDMVKSVEDLIKNADKALYQAKQNGRNQIYAHPPTSDYSI
ncbi:MAG: diguanylate cyclase [Gammaproteobacteria bacterium]|nr:diguanylate cyclase [Gammaproteobacteria bacterium]